MRMLGHKSNLTTFRWDLVYLAAYLLADKRPGVSDLAAAVQAGITQIAAERDLIEEAENQDVIAAALLTRADKYRDEVVIKVGGVARASDKEVYAILFSTKAPSAIARLSIVDESIEVARILGEMAALPADHPLRATYEQELIEVEASVKAAGQQSDAAETALALSRSSRDRFKVSLDKLRLETHGKLTVLLKEKAEVDAFFRPTTAAPGGTKDEGTPVPA